MTDAPYFVRLPTTGEPSVEAWVGYQLQFAGMRAQAWQEALIAELQGALHALAPDQLGCLTGTYATSDTVACDVENRLFTNPGNAIPRRFRSVRFERSPSPPPEPPAALDRIAGQLHYYRYEVADDWRCWEPDKILAIWSRVPRQLAGDGSGRPAWLAMKAAVEKGLVTATGTLSAAQPFGLRLVVHATPSGPRSAPSVSEPLVDGVIAAFHAGDTRPSVADILAARLGAKAAPLDPADIERFVRTDGPGPLFPGSPFRIGGGVVHLSPADDRCVAGEVAIEQDA